MPHRRTLNAISWRNLLPILLIASGFISHQLLKSQQRPSSIKSPVAARQLEGYMDKQAITQTQFAIQLGISDRTLRSFRKTGKVS